MSLHYIEGNPDPKSALQGKVARTVIEALAAYRVVLGKAEMRLIYPLPPSIRSPGWKKLSAAWLPRLTARGRGFIWRPNSRHGWPRRRKRPAAGSSAQRFTGPATRNSFQATYPKEQRFFGSFFQKRTASCLALRSRSD
jgi:hypothetical protein